MDSSFTALGTIDIFIDIKVSVYKQIMFGQLWGNNKVRYLSIDESIHVGFKEALFYSLIIHMHHAFPM